MTDPDKIFYFTPSDELNDALQKVTGGEGEFITVGNRTTRMDRDGQPMSDALQYLRENGRHFTAEEGRAAILCMMVALSGSDLSEEEVGYAVDAMATAMGTFSVPEASSLMQIMLSANNNSLGDAIEDIFFAFGEEYDDD